MTSGPLNQLLHDSLSRLDTRNRFNFLADLDAFAKWNLIPAVDYLKAISALKNETNYIILDGITSGLAKINKFKTKLGIEDKFKQFRREFFSPAYGSVGYEAENDVTDGLLQALLLEILGNSNHTETLDYANAQFTKMTTDLSSVKVNSTF